VQTEYVVACEFLDEEHPPPATSPLHDNNTYTFGYIGHHNVVIACLLKGKYGLTSAASVARDMRRSFTSIRFGLIVGIKGSAPSPKHDIRLGDVLRLILNHCRFSASRGTSSHAALSGLIL
jgi:hypothetical protein